MKLNNKGFMITGILYSLLLLFLALIIGMLAILSAKQNKMTYISKDIISKLNDKYDINAIKVWTFGYTGDYQTFVAPTDGYYNIQLWGAQGGSGLCTYTQGCKYNDGGKGAYTRGNIYLTKGETLYIYVGGSGKNATAVNVNNNGGYNGGGTGGNGGSDDSAGGGGGATDIRLVNGNWDNFESLKSRLMVASGGGGGACLSAVQTFPDDLSINYRNGATYQNMSIVTYGYYSTYQCGIDATTQISGSSFGKGKSGSTNAHGAGGGGAGYYGGTFCLVNGHGSGGSGGSSFISGLAGCDAIAESSTESNIVHTGQANHYSGKVFSDAYMVAGNSEMPTHDGASTMTGNTGNGYAKISLLKETSNTDKILVTFDAAGGSVDVTGKEVAYGETYGDLPTPTREGYTFKGWNGKNMFDEEKILMAINGATYENDYYKFNDGQAYNLYSNSIPQLTNFKENTQYTFTFDGYTEYTNHVTNFRFVFAYTDGTEQLYFLEADEATRYKWFTTSQNKTLNHIKVYYGWGGNVYMKDVQLEEGDTATEYEPYYIKSDTKVVQNQNHTLTAIWEPINYGSSIQSSYSTIFYSLNREPKTQVDEMTTGTWTGSFSGTINIISLISNSGSKITTPTNSSGNAVAVYSGTNTVNFTTQQLNKWVCLDWRWGGRSGTKQLGNIKLLFNNNQNYTISQAVSNEYIEPLVPYRSADVSRVNDMSYVLDNPEQLLTGGSQIKAFSNFQVCFKVKKLSPLKAVNFETNGDWVKSVGSDGFNAYSSDKIEFSL